MSSPCLKTLTQFSVASYFALRSSLRDTGPSSVGSTWNWRAAGNHTPRT